MTEPEPARPRGTPPSAKELVKLLGPRRATWDATVAMVQEFGATWRWVHSESSWTWGYRAYLPGDRFFVGLSMPDDRLEASLNLTDAEWYNVVGEGAAERAFLDALRPAEPTGEAPAWVHVPLPDPSVMSALAKLLVARAQRVQPPRRGKRKR